MSYFYVLFVLLVLIYLHLTRNFNYWKSRSVPFLKPSPIFGNIYSMITFKKSLFMLLHDIYTKSETPYFGFFVFDQPFLLLKDPELIKQVLMTDFEYFADRSIMLNKRDKYSSGILFLLQNPDWKIARYKASPAFTSKKLKNMIPLIAEVGEELVKNIERKALNKEFVNCRSYSVQYAINVISSCAFGIKGQAHENSLFSLHCEQLQGTSFIRCLQMVSHFFAPVMVNIFRMNFFDQNSSRFLEQVFLNTLNERKVNCSTRGDFIDLLLKINVEDNRFNTDAIVSLALQYLVAGFETSGATVSFILHELSLNEDIQHKLRNEILAVLGDDKAITFEAIQEMTYLDMVIKEVLRKYPILPFLDRRCIKSYKIPHSNLIIEKGIPVYIPLWSLHHDENYFPEPQIFDPERFSLENKTKIRPYTYIPFGDGYRNCIGFKFGILIVSVAIIQILRKFKIEKSVRTPDNLVYEPTGFLILPKECAINVKFRSLSP